tara:strand:+ start:5165 stop:5599 length:435 start_codon:yes stop_codon:yes gene_type:complete
MSEQRVNIQYSITIDQLPNEIDRLYKLAKNTFTEMDTELFNTSSKLDISIDSIEKINKIRERLANVDHQLMDINGIMTGYMNFISAPKQATKDNANEENDVEPESLENMSLLDLENKLNHFKNNYTMLQNSNDQISPEKHSDTQ